MAEDLSDTIQSMDFHPCDTPRGMLYYDMEILTKLQQTKLNTLKIETLRENQKYLAAHPEIRACVAIISRLVMRQRPRTNIHETIAEYFAKSKVDIESDVNEYLERRKPYNPEAVSALNLIRADADSISESDSSDRDGSRGTLLAFRQMISHHESEFWKAGISEITTPDLQMQQSESLRNMSIDFDKIVKSISNTNQIAGSSEQSKSLETVPASGAKMPTHISEYLHITKIGGVTVNQDGNSSYGGHIPTIEDYDAGYSKRRRTYVSDTTEGFTSEISQILVEKPTPSTIEEVEVQLEPCQHLSDADISPKASETVRPDLSPVGIRGSVEMKSLLEKHTSIMSESAMQRLDGDFRDIPGRMARKVSSLSKTSRKKSSSKTHMDASDTTKEKPDRTISFHMKKSSSSDKTRIGSVTKFTPDITEADRKDSGELKSRLKKTSIQ